MDARGHDAVLRRVRALPRLTRLRFATGLTLLVGAALALRLWGIRSGLPWIYNVDEADHFVSRAVAMAHAGTLQPDYWGNPPAFTYLLLILFHLAYGGGAAIAHASGVWLVARVASATLGALSVGLLGLAGAKLFDRRAGLLAAALLAVAFLPVAYGKLALNDAPVLFGVCLSLWGSAGVLRDGRARDYLLAGLGLGLAASTKYTGGIVALPLAAAALADRRPAMAAAAALVAVAAFVATDPYALSDWSAFTNGIAHQSSQSSTGAGKLGLTGSGIVYYLWSATWGVGWAPSLAALGGATWLARADRPAFFLLVPALVAFLVFMGLEDRYFGRYLMAVIPMMCLLGAYAATALADALPRTREPALALLAAGLCAQGAIDSVHSGVVNSRADTRTQTLAWLDAHVPARTRMVIEPIAPAAWSRRWAGYPIFARTRRRADGRLALVRHSQVSLENYERTLSPALVSLYRRSRYCWVVTGSTEQGRALVTPAAVPAAIGYYRALAAQGTAVFTASPYPRGAAPINFNFDWSFDYYPSAYARPGPLVVVYRLHHCRPYA